MKDGGNAFPLEQHSDGFVTCDSGMTLRDYFAGQALTGIMACGAAIPPEGYVASVSYKYADAMLAEREKPEPQQANVPENTDDDDSPF